MKAKHTSTKKDRKPATPTEPNDSHKEGKQLKETSSQPRESEYVINLSTYYLADLVFTKGLIHPPVGQ